MKKIILCALCAAMMLLRWLRAEEKAPTLIHKIRQSAIFRRPRRIKTKPIGNTGDEPVAQADSNSGTSDSD